MKLSDYDYQLPASQIARFPAEQRDHSRLLVYHLSNNQIEHKNFFNLPDYLTPDDFIVVNTTRVMKARLYGHKASSGGKFELLLLRELETGLWESLVKPGRGMHPGIELEFENTDITAEIVAVHPDGSRTLRFHPAEQVYALMESQGEIPLPPYFQRNPIESDYIRYQTVYNNTAGSVAAPTAGLHFTPEILQDLKNKGIKVIEILLDIGWGTFQPVRESDPRKHKIESETYHIGNLAARKIAELKQSGKNLVAIGTTSVRALESWYRHTEGRLEPASRATDLYIYPPYEFKLVDKLVTNFHLPQSTLLMLVAALAGRDNILKVYREAVQTGYRFFSYGDCMVIL